MEQHLRSVIAGGDLAGYGMGATTIDYGANEIAPINANIEDRNRTAPFPFCGNRFEFRAVGSSQNIGFPMAVLNAAYAESMGILSDMIEGGMSVRDAVAKMLDDNERVIFNGNGYSDEWPVEAELRGLPNLRNGCEAIKVFNSEKNKELFVSQNVFTEKEVDARQEIMAESIAQDIAIEVDCMLMMLNTGVLPACAKDLQTFEGTGLGAERKALYSAVENATRSLREAYENIPEGDAIASMEYAQYTLRPAMQSAREQADAAELLVQDGLWPYPKYKDILFDHHSQPAKYE